MSDLFKESDCDEWRSLMNIEKLNRGYGSSAAMEQYGFIRIDKANRLVAEFLSKGTVVYGIPEMSERQWLTPLTENNVPIGSSHRALLINIEPIAKDSAESLIDEILKANRVLGFARDFDMDKWIDRAKALRSEK